MASLAAAVGFALLARVLLQGHHILDVRRGDGRLGLAHPLVEQLLGHLLKRQLHVLGSLGGGLEEKLDPVGLHPALYFLLGHLAAA